MQKDPKGISVKDWIITQSKDPTVRKSKSLINNKKAKRVEGVSQDPQINRQYLRQCSQLVLHKGILDR